MNWINPARKLPEDNQLVVIMIEPHKHRRTIKNSLPSIEIVCGWYENGFVENHDELGLGAICWKLDNEQEDNYSPRAIAWMPAEELSLPKWLK